MRFVALLLCVAELRSKIVAMLLRISQSDSQLLALVLRLVPLALRLAQLVLQLLDLLCVEQLRGTLGGTPAPARPAQPVALLLQLSGALALLLEEGFLLTQLLLQLCVDVVQPEVPRLRDSQLEPAREGQAALGQRVCAPSARCTWPT